MILIDTAFDFNSDAAGGDPDSKSSTLRNYHKLLWSKPLPNGSPFNLNYGAKDSYLSYNSGTYEVSLSSDSIGNSYRDSKKMAAIIERLDFDTVESFRSLNSTIGGYIIFPAKKIDGEMTINQMRGVSQVIGDRFDLTLECIRRFYKGTSSPLGETLNRYSEFFNLFDSFQGYVDFFLLNDLVSESDYQVNFFTSIEELFLESPLPKNPEEYLEYRMNSMRFTAKRNDRIAEWAKAH